ncbi:nitroreductase family protein [Ethanoligenens sp.]|uniref:nitroreductase family protein n=1 Tax=Ethanoligenens sp. TaxID=2099655 RepID=UPI0039ECC225
MAFIDLAHERYSVRKFRSNPVEHEKLERILRAGQLAPTACNYQPQRIIVVENEEAHKKIRKCTPCHFNAPVVLIVCYDNNSSAKRRSTSFDIGVIDASIVATQMMLEVADIGLGVTWVEDFEPDAVIQEFALPKNIIPVALLPLGYPADDAKPNERLHNSRKPLEETVFYNHLN